MEIVSSPEMQANWRYEEKKKGMYIDGHEQEDMVEDQKGFVACWKEYKTQFQKWDNNSKAISCLFRLSHILTLTSFSSHTMN